MNNTNKTEFMTKDEFFSSKKQCDYCKYNYDCPGHMTMGYNGEPQYPPCANDDTPMEHEEMYLGYLADIGYDSELELEETKNGK